jgi:hypothetical protein
MAEVRSRPGVGFCFRKSFLGWPSIVEDAVAADDHSCTVLACVAVNENGCLRFVIQYGERGLYFAWRRVFIAVERKLNIAHTNGFHFLLFPRWDDP